MSDKVIIREVGPRDGFQNESTILSTNAKLEIIEGLESAGLSWIEVTSFVSSRRVPQLADAEELLHRLPGHSPVTQAVFVPNQRGLERAIASGATEATTAVAASDEINRRNFGVSAAEAMEALPKLLATASESDVRLTLTLGTAFGCSVEGEIAPERILALAEQAIGFGFDELVLGDTVGLGNPRQVTNLYSSLIERFPGVCFGAHFHDTRGLGAANAYAAYEVGVRTFDASVGGLGGCPFAPGAAGNVATEGLVNMFEQMGVNTGIDLDALVRVAAHAARLFGRALDSAVMRATLAEK